MSFPSVHSKRPPLTRTAALLSALFVIAFSVNPTEGSAKTVHQSIATSGVHAQSGCGTRVYMTSSGAAANDATNDTNVKTSLETGTNLCITIGVPYHELSTVANALTTASYDTVYVQGQNNWGSSPRSQFDTSDMQVITDFLSAGGGVVVGEWHAWNACREGYAGAWGLFDAIMPARIRTGCAYGSNQKVRFYRWTRPVAAQIDTGVPSDFVFEPADFSGSLSFMTLKTGATPYFYATWNQVLANVPVATDPSNLPSAGGVGMAGWVPSGLTGRVFSFSTTNGAPEMSDTSSANSFRRLVANALGWAGSAGGSLNPDSVAVTTSVGTNVATSQFVPTRFVGTVTYSIASGTLPPGMSLNTATGVISGSSCQTGTYAVVVQGSGSSSGQAQSAVNITVNAGSNSQCTSTSSTTPPSPSNVSVTASAPTAIVANTGLMPGSALATLDGAKVPVTLSRTSSGITITGSNFGMKLTGLDSSKTSGNLNTSGQLVLDTSGYVRVSGSGFKPNSVVSVFVFSTPTSLGTVNTDSKGSFDKDFAIPNGLESGNHTIQANGYTTDDKVRSLNLGVIVPKPSSLPNTGGQTSDFALVGVTLFAIGYFTVRRRSIIA
jgi:LPXTG-motif cell wall-anchored protein